MEKPAYWRMVQGLLAYMVPRTPRVSKKCLHGAPASASGGAALAPAIMIAAQAAAAAVQERFLGIGGERAAARALVKWAATHAAAAAAAKLPAIARSMAVDAMGNADWGNAAAFTAVADFCEALASPRSGGGAAATAAAAAAAERVYALTPAETLAEVRQCIPCRCLGSR